MLRKFTCPQALLFGAASVLNISGVMEQPSYLDRSEAEALRGDFERVGDDLFSAMQQQPVQPSELEIQQQLFDLAS